MKTLAKYQDNAITISIVENKEGDCAVRRQWHDGERQRERATVGLSRASAFNMLSQEIMKMAA